MIDRNDVSVTRHAEKRTKQRVGIPKKISDKNAAKALECGVRHKDTKGALNRYLTSLFFKDMRGNNIRIYCNNVYIFNKQTLITVFPLPQKFRKTATRLQQKMAGEAKYENEGIKTN